jgi:Polyketide cyclase / dehydrase and lipid transport
MPVAVEIGGSLESTEARLPPTAGPRSHPLGRGSRSGVPTRVRRPDEGLVMEFSNTITIERSPHDVFVFVSDLENVPKWNHAIVETRKISDGPVLRRDNVPAGSVASL